MNERIAQELELLRSHFTDLAYREEGQWVLLPHFRAPANLWDRDSIAVCFQIAAGHPGQKPYGFYVSPRILLLSGQEVLNRTDSTEPPFPGEWAKFSWDAPEWRATADLRSGSNLLNWALTFSHRLDEGA